MCMCSSRRHPPPLSVCALLSLHPVLFHALYPQFLFRFAILHALCIACVLRVSVSVGARSMRPWPPSFLTSPPVLYCLSSHTQIFSRRPASLRARARARPQHRYVTGLIKSAQQDSRVGLTLPTARPPRMHQVKSRDFFIQPKSKSGALFTPPLS